MPIPNVTNKTAGFPELGRVYKGKKKSGKRAGADLQMQMRVELNPDEPDLIKWFEAKYGSLTPERIDILFPFDDPARFWDANYVCYKGKSQVIKVGGEESLEVQYFRDPITNDLLVKDWRALQDFESNEIVGRAGERVAFDMSLNHGKGPVIYGTKSRSYHVEAEGRLRVMLAGSPPAFGFLMVVPNSIRDITNISEQLNGLSLIFRSYGDVLGVSLSHVRATLYRTPQTYPFTGPDGKRTSKTGYFFNIQPDMAWMNQLNEASRQMLQNKFAELSAPDVPELPSGGNGHAEDEDILEIIEGEIIEENSGDTVPDLDMLASKRPTSVDDHKAFWTTGREYYDDELLKGFMQVASNDAQGAYDQLLDYIQRHGVPG